MADVLSAAERRMIDAAVAGGMVTRCAPGASAYGLVESAKTGKLVWVNRLALEMGREGTAGFRARMQGERSAQFAKRRAKVRALQREGHTVAEMANRLGVSVDLVRRDLARMGLKARRADPNAEKRARAAARRAEVARLVAGGASVPEMAGALGVSPATIWGDCREMGMRPAPPRAPGGHGGSTVAEAVVAQASRGVTPPKIAAALGVSLKTVYSHLRAGGYDPAAMAELRARQRLDAVRALHRAGLSGRQIGERLGRSHTVICRDIRALRERGEIE